MSQFPGVGDPLPAAQQFYVERRLRRLVPHHLAAHVQHVGAQRGGITRR